ncbi:hypothetical protein C882_2728 [Caenispirillum salinarum AK4]|uniref:Transmembrane protein n=1 Tax=Caenispirillum salinarum AK4 TaxID=1238182 RepID=K9H6J6_9PROT|nr:DUF599 family protein [Caenispirillum salinarum]EKV32649.1 hypothetical protein C882_2728 [Caenispirillum salinarum AK4]
MLEWIDVWDGAALVWFFAVWAAYTAYADHGPAHARSITAAMNARRRAWMHEAARRDLRMIDTNILGNLLTGVGFFSSTTIFVIGGLIAMIGVADQSALALARLPLTDAAQPAALEIKTAGLLVIFIYAFFKFAWAFRLANYCSITVGGLPAAADGESAHSKRIAEVAAMLSARSGHHFNRGLRAYFFALAALGWLIGPAVFAVLTTGVALVLYRREFKSKALFALRDLNP